MYMCTVVHTVLTRTMHYTLPHFSAAANFTCWTRLGLTLNLTIVVGSRVENGASEAILGGTWDSIPASS